MRVGEAKPETTGIPVASLARLWPNRQHESNWLKNLLYCLGMHRWHELDIGPIVPGEMPLSVAGARRFDIAAGFDDRICGFDLICRENHGSPAQR
jgi:hypothetical protein